MARLSLVALTKEDLRSTFDYSVETGRLIRRRRGLGARVGVEIGSVDPSNGHRRAYYRGGNRMTAHLVWAWHNGALPVGILKHKNCINDDDRIENLEPVKKPIRIVLHDGAPTEFGRVGEKVSCIYEILCTENGRKYIGSAVDADKRWVMHVTQLASGRHHSKHLQRAWDKYGEDAFSFRIVERCDRESLIAREQHYIDTLKPEFNSRPNAASQLGWKPTDEARARMRASAIGNTNRKGKKQSEEAKERIRLNRKGKGGGPHGQERRRNVAKGLMRSVSDLTEDSVREGRRLRAEGLSAPQIAKRVGCSTWAAYDFLSRRTFGWVE